MIKKENFVSSVGQDTSPTYVESLIEEHNKAYESHAQHFYEVAEDLNVHELKEIHLKEGEREKWDGAANNLAAVSAEMKADLQQAGTYATNAAVYAGQANASRLLAKDYQDAAKDSETKADNYAKDAQAYAGLAKNYADSAAKDAADGVNWANSALTYSSKAENAATRAELALDSMKVDLSLKANAKTSGGGFVAGEGSATEDSAAAIGKSAKAKNGGFAGGLNTFSNAGGAAGQGAKVYGYGGAIGMNTIAGKGFSGGYGAIAAKGAHDEDRVNCIQLGSGTNSIEKSLQVYEYQLMGADGKIPFERLPLSFMNFKGEVDTFSDLPNNASEGDVYRIKEESEWGYGTGSLLPGGEPTREEFHVEKNGCVVSYGGNWYPFSDVAWIKEGYYTKSETDAKVSAVTHFGGNVSSMSQLPSSPKAGTYCYVTADISNGVKYTGRVGDLFSCDGGDLWSYTLLFAPPSKCVYTEPDVTVNPSYTYIYNESGTRLGSISIDPTEMPGAFDASLLGVTSADDTVTFYLGIHNNGTFPARIYNFKAGEMIFWNGSMWCAVPPSSVVDKIKSELLAIKQKSIPHTSVSEYPVNISDQLENEDVINYRIYGNSVQSETPSADNPVEVQSVGDLVTDSENEYYGKYDVPVIMCGKNLLPYPYSTTTATINGITFTENGDGSITVNGTATANATYYIYRNFTSLINGLNIGDTVTVSINNDKTWAASPSTMAIVCNYYDSNKSMKDGGCTLNSTTNYKTTTIGDDWVGMALYVVVYSGKTIDKITLKPQIEFGSNNTEYEPYICETKHFYLNEPLRKVVDYADYIDFENQKVVRQVKEKVLDGTENWVYQDTTGLIYLGNVFPNSISTQDGYSTHFAFAKYAGTNLPYFIVVTNTYGYAIIRLYQQEGNVVYSTTDDFKTFLAEQYSAGTPVTVYFKCKPLEESITAPELTALNSEVMNIFSSTATPPSNIDFVYYQDINKVIAELKNAILSQGGDV